MPSRWTDLEVIVWACMVGVLAIAAALLVGCAGMPPLPPVPPLPWPAATTTTIAGTTTTTTTLPPAADWTGPQVVALPAGNWVLRFEASGLVQDPGRAGDGGWEHIFLDVSGAGVARFWLMNMGGGRNMRGLLEGSGGEWKSWHNGKDLDQPAGGVGNFVVTRKGGRLTAAMNDRSWFDIPAGGVPQRAIVGGCRFGNRAFKGKVRCVTVEGEG